MSSLEEAGCDLALVMTGADEARFFELRRTAKYGVGMDPISFDPRVQTVRRQALAEPVNCAVLAPIFARVARPKHLFYVYSGSDPPFNDRCAGAHNRKGKYLSGEGPGYPDREPAESGQPAR